MQNPINWVKGWQSSTKRYTFVSVILTVWALYKQEMISFSDLSGILFAPIGVQIQWPYAKLTFLVAIERILFCQENERVRIF